MGEAQRGGLKYRMMNDADGGPSGDLSRGYFYLYDGHIESMHRHGITETVLVVEGTGRAWLGEREVTISPGDALFIPAGIMQGFEADADRTLFFTIPRDTAHAEAAIDIRSLESSCEGGGAGARGTSLKGQRRATVTDVADGRLRFACKLSEFGRAPPR